VHQRQPQQGGPGLCSRGGWACLSVCLVFCLSDLSVSNGYAAAPVLHSSGSLPCLNFVCGQQDRYSTCSRLTIFVCLLLSAGDPRHLHQDGAQLQLGWPALALELAAHHAVPTQVPGHHSRWARAWKSSSNDSRRVQRVLGAARQLRPACG
jgi:hypothetical protein